MSLRQRTLVLILSAVATTAVAASAGAAKRPAVRILNASQSVIEADPALHAYVKATAEHAIGAHCAHCHGADLKGKSGVPDLTDYERLWGTGAAEDIDATQIMSLQQTILWGIRDQGCPDSERKQQYGACVDTRYSHMPAYGKDKLYTSAQIADVAEYVMQLSHQDADAAAAARGKRLYADGCGECHAQDGFGYAPYGGPNLTDDLWLYGGTRSAIVNTLASGPGPDGNGGVCPPWASKLDAATIKALAIYIHGKASELY